MNSVQSFSQQFSQQGFVLLEQHLSAAMLAALEQEYQRLSAEAAQILQDIHLKRLSFADYYQQQQHGLIAVPETSDPTQLCRFEYIAGRSAYVREHFVPFCEALLAALIGEAATLFKDKCNLKLPGGGAFEAHQDIPAYIDFGPNFHVTVAVFLDPATTENGALQVADNALALTQSESNLQSVGEQLLPVFPTYQGGPDNGRIVAELEQQLHWKSVTTRPGDLLLFNSYLPHRSAVNHSECTRRAFFFTFNLAAAGCHYESYYRSKRADFGHPRFHVATPTEHNSSHSHLPTR